MATIRQVNNDLSSLNVGCSDSWFISVSISGKANKKTLAASGSLMLMETRNSPKYRLKITPKLNPEARTIGLFLGNRLTLALFLECLMLT